MPNRKFKCPAVGQLVCIKSHVLLYKRNFIKEMGNVLIFNLDDPGQAVEPFRGGETALFLGIFEIERRSLNSLPSWSYKFLTSGRVVYSVMSYEKPKQWLAHNVRVIKDGKQA